VFKASGHVDGFSDPLIDCKKCHQRFRADKLIEANVSDANISENTKTEILTDIIKTNNVPCPSCGASD
jgi:glycyl-tRNA synthetase